MQNSEVSLWQDLDRLLRKLTVTSEMELRTKERLNSSKSGWGGVP